jgi:hypothetical protein
MLSALDVIRGMLDMPARHPASFPAFLDSLPKA